METWVACETKFQGNIIEVRAGTARLEDGYIAPREVVLQGGGVCVAALADGEALLVRQYRIAVGRMLLELPAGRLEPGEEPISRAAAELEEETGYRAGRLEHVASFYCSPGVLSERIHVYAGFDLERTAQRLDHDERVEAVRMPLDEVERGLAEGRFEDAKTIIGLRELLVRRKRRGR